MIKQPYTFWDAELLYIQSVNPHFPGSAYNYDSHVFKHYCEMQAKHALSDGYTDIAQSILDCLDNTELFPGTYEQLNKLTIKGE